MESLVDDFLILMKSINYRVVPWGTSLIDSVARQDNVTMVTAFVLGANYLLLIKFPFLLGDFELHCLQHLIVWADYIHMPVSNLMSLDCF